MLQFINLFILFVFVFIVHFLRFVTFFFSLVSLHPAWLLDTFPVEVDNLTNYLFDKSGDDGKELFAFE